MARLKSPNGSVLIFAIWTLSLLVVFASYIGLRIRQRAEVISRIEDRSILRHLSEAGVKKAVATIRRDMAQNGFDPNVERKQALHANPARFGRTVLGTGTFEIGYDDHNIVSGKSRFVNGVEDEDAKINLNLCDWAVIRRLFQIVLAVKDEEATALADAVVGWREFGDTQAKGFYSEDYYQQLEYPYKVKHAEFETLDELRLLEGVTEEVYEKILPFVTIYGSGQININTAPKEILMALGLDNSMADKILQVRRGVDDEEYTADDVVFQKPFDLASDVKKIVELTKEEIKQIDDLNATQLISVNSSVFKITSKAILPQRNLAFNSVVIYNALEGKIEYWQEK
ncbi:MAG: general secretion pathway protein GspK [Candidatus Omnitrophica bacterium]|nr:general secretion pathway protein GspK [Candidatus Omnitrophota bacterium]